MPTRPALCREAQQVLRPDLRILDMSANMPNDASCWNSPVVENHDSKPVEIIYTEDADDQFYPSLLHRMIVRAKNEHEGIYWHFFCREAESEKCEALLDSRNLIFQFIHCMVSFLRRNNLRPLYPDKQGATKSCPGNVYCRNEFNHRGIKVVVDCGFWGFIEIWYSFGAVLTWSQFQKTLPTQRAGTRASQQCCYHVVKTGSHWQRTPEILETGSLRRCAGVPLWAYQTISTTCGTPPPKASLSQSAETLEQLGLLKTVK